MAVPEWQKAFVLNSLQFLMRNHPFAEVAAAALSFSSDSSFESAPFSNGEFRFPRDLGNLSCRVEVLDPALRDDGIQCSFNPFKSLNHVVIVHDLPPHLSCSARLTAIDHSSLERWKTLTRLSDPFPNVVAGKSTNERDR